MIIARKNGGYNTQMEKNGSYLKVIFLTRCQMANVGNQKQKLLYIMEEISKLYEKIGDYDNALIYYNKLFEVINYNLYIINNETKDADAYDRYIFKRNSIKLNIESLNKKIF